MGWDLLRSRGWQVEPGPKIVSKYFGGKQAFAFDQSGDFVVVVGHAWLLKKGRAVPEITDDASKIQAVISRLDREPLEPTDDDTYFAMLAYLSSSVAYDLIAYLSPQISGGQLDLSNKYLENMPVPNLATLTPESLGKLTLVQIRL